MALNPDKTLLGVQNRGLLDYVVSEKGRKLDPDKIAVINTLPLKGIAKLLWYVGWYRELIHNYSKIDVFITQLFRKDCKFEWNEACKKTFEKLWDKLNTYPVLRPPDWDKPVYMFCNASNVAVGNVLCQSMGEKGKNASIC